MSAASDLAAALERVENIGPLARVLLDRQFPGFVQALDIVAAAARDREQAVEAERRRCAKVLTDEAARLDDTWNSFDADSAQLLRGMAAALLEGEK